MEENEHTDTGGGGEELNGQGAELLATLSQPKSFQTRDKFFVI